MIPNPILKVLSMLTSHRVRYLLMGGQACVFYGAAQFSRDTDIAVLADTENLSRLARALAELEAVCIAVPPFDRSYLLRGHAVHFRCGHPEARNMRVDVMAVLRGVAPFEELWSRRTALEIESGLVLDLLALPDLVQAKKTQREKDWPMIRRLVEAHYARNRGGPSAEQVAFWLREARSPDILVEVARTYPDVSSTMLGQRPLLALAVAGDASALEAALQDEANRERDADRAYWAPLRAELEALRFQRRKK